MNAINAHSYLSMCRSLFIEDRLRLTLADLFYPSLAYDTCGTMLWTRIQKSVVSNADAGSTAIIELGYVYPNPVATGASIEFSLSESAECSVSVMDILGRPIVQALSLSVQAEGRHRIQLPIAGLPSGSYICSVLAGGQRKSRLFKIIDR
jgi:hypothetical protein